jgi:hypothetical protein
MCGAAGGDGLDEQPGRDRLNLHAEARPGDLAVGDQLTGDPFGEIDRDREAEPDAPPTRAPERRTGRVDADELRLAVDESTAAVAGLIDASVWIAPTRCAVPPLSDGTRTYLFSALTIPAVTVLVSPSGEPSATTGSPT